MGRTCPAMRIPAVILILISIKFCVANSPVAASQVQNKQLAKSNYTIYGLTIGKARLPDFFSKLGPTIVFEDDSNSEARCICYVSDRDETLILIKLENYRRSRFKLMSQKMKFYKWHFCERSLLVSDNLSFQNGIKLGMDKARIKSVFGSPEEETPDRLRYAYRWKENIQDNEAIEVDCDPDMLHHEHCRTVTLKVIADFFNSKLINLDIRIDSDTPSNP